MEEYYFRVTGKALPSIIEIDVHERPLQKNNILCIVLEDTSLPSGNEVYKILYHPHSDWKDFSTYSSSMAACHRVFNDMSVIFHSLK